jgi:hypothetical protein
MASGPLIAARDRGVRTWATFCSDVGHGVALCGCVGIGVVWHYHSGLRYVAAAAAGRPMPFCSLSWWRLGSILSVPSMTYP